MDRDRMDKFMENIKMQRERDKVCKKTGHYFAQTTGNNCEYCGMTIERATGWEENYENL